MRLKIWHCLATITFVVLAVYYPSLHAGYNSVDDLKMLSGIESAGPIDFSRLFFPHGNSYYYRPLTILTYLFDRDVWGAIASFMHLENILLHLGCAFLVFFTTCHLSKIHEVNGKGVALFAGLLFGLHPLTSESVCWISGRTDLLAGFFLLLSVLMLFLGICGRRPYAFLFSGVALLAGCLAKEVTVFILPGLLWMVAVLPDSESFSIKRFYQRRLALITPVIAVIAYFAMRSFATARDAGVKTAISGVSGADYDLLGKIRVGLKVYGFYFKKIFIPWPLNFGIVEISGWNVLAGLILIFLLLWAFVRRETLGAFILMGFCVLSPSILIPFGKMAWTPVAERYLYIPIAIFAPVAAIFLWGGFHASVPRRKKFFRAAMLALLLVFSMTTLHRSWIWQDNARLYADTVAKSPNFPPAKAELANALAAKGQTAEAEAILEEMQEDGSPSDYLVDDFNLAMSYLEGGKTEEARNLLMPYLENTSKKYYDLLQALLKINDCRIAKAEKPDDRLLIQEESLDWLKEQMRLRPNAFTRYRIGKMEISMADEQAALHSFREVLEMAPRDAHYRGAAETLLKKLENR